MSQKQVVVSDDQTKLQVTIGPPYGLVHVVNIDLTDSRNIVEGIVQILSLGDAITNGRINALTEQVASLEKRLLSADDIQRIVHLLRTCSNEFRADGRPTNDDLLANKVETMSKG
jgi:hypothetical protein